MKPNRLSMIIAASLTMFTMSNFAQDDLRTSLFRDVDKVMTTAKEKNAHLFGPTSFREAMEYYKDAEEDLRRGRNIQDIRTKVNQAITYLQKSIQMVKLGEVTFSTTMAARADALSADAPHYSADTWKRAEARFKAAVEQLEDGDVKDAQKIGGEAERFYRVAELEAIKANYLNPAKTLIKQADDMDAGDSAPKTLARAKKLALDAEALLQRNRYDTDEARQLAQEAKYEASHAIFLHKLFTKLDQEDKRFEDLRLIGEKEITRIAGELDLVARFDNGYEPPVDEILAEIKKRENKANEAAQSIARLEDENANLKKQVESMTGRLGSLTLAEKELQTRLEQKAAQEWKIVRVGELFSVDEAKVLRDRDNIIIRLYGLTFPVGRSTIEPQFFALLTKIQQAVKEFPGCQVVIEGHSDSYGTDETNQILSEERARAVEEYLRANMGASTPITSQGYGESKPIASNETVEGRSKNRRIDVVIVPEWSIPGK